MSKRFTGRPPVAVRIELIESVMNRIVGDMHRAMALDAMYSRVNNDTAFRSLFNQTYEANGLNALTSALLHELMIVLMRMIDHCGNGGPYGSNRATVLRVAEMLDDDELLEALVEKAREWVPDLPRISEKNAATARAKLMRAREAIVALRDGSEGQMWRSALKEHRNNFLAHSLVGLEKKETLRFGYLGEFLNAFKPIVEDLRFGIFGDNWDIEDFHDSYRDMSENFWSLVEAGHRARREALEEDDTVSTPRSRQ